MPASVCAFHNFVSLDEHLRHLGLSGVAVAHILMGAHIVFCAQTQQDHARVLGELVAAVQSWHQNGNLPLPGEAVGCCSRRVKSYHANSLAHPSPLAASGGKRIEGITDYLREHLGGPGGLWQSCVGDYTAFRHGRRLRGSGRATSRIESHWSALDCGLLGGFRNSEIRTLVLDMLLGIDRSGQTSSRLSHARLFQQRRIESDADHHTSKVAPDIARRRLQALFLCLLSAADAATYAGGQAGIHPPVVSAGDGEHIFVQRGIASIFIESEADEATLAARTACLGAGSMPLASVVDALIPPGSFPVKPGYSPPLPIY